MAEQDEKIPTIAEDIVVTKYKMAAEIVNRKRFVHLLIVWFLLVVGSGITQVRNCWYIYEFYMPIN